MMYLPDDLFDKCRTALLNCEEFEQLSTLKDFLTTDELCPFKYEIPFGRNQKELVDGFLAYILEKHVKSGRPALPVLLATLRDRYTDARNEELAQLLAQVQVYESPAKKDASLSLRQQQDLNQKLLTLDFRPQVREFKEVIQEQRVAAFLVHGPPQHGQGLLTRRLIRFREEWGTGQQIVIDASSNGIGKSSSALWGQIASKLNLPYDTDKEVLAEKVCQWWETQDVIFVFHPVDYIPPDIFAAWLDEFWKPIAVKARQKLSVSLSDTHLLLFLLDFGGQVSQTTITLLDHAGELVNSYAPLKLPPTDKVREEELEFWIDTVAEVLPGTVDAMALIRATDHGTPDLLYKEIFACCGLTWEGVKLP